MMRLTDVMHLPGLHALDMEQVARTCWPASPPQVPKMMRPGVYRSLEHFTHLRRLNMGANNGGKEGSYLSDCVRLGFSRLACLVQVPGGRADPSLVQPALRLHRPPPRRPRTRCQGHT